MVKGCELFDATLAIKIENCQDTFSKCVKPQFANSANSILQHALFLIKDT